MSGENLTKALALVRNELLRLARFEDALAAAEADAVPYGMPCPDTVRSRRMAAVALRADAEAVDAEVGLETLALHAEGVSTMIDWNSPRWVVASRSSPLRW
jgi:hypothetical protein